MIPGWANNLNRLRGVGSSRRSPSTAYSALKSKLSRGDVLFDLGCGESNDRLIAKSQGVTAYGVDLFPPKKRSIDGFIRADIRCLPFKDSTADAVICQAVVSLIPSDDRFPFYAEISRVLQSSGWLSIVFFHLVDGWQIKPDHESQRLVALGFHYVRSGLYQKGGM